jgi:hypothetical protein
MIQSINPIAIRAATCPSTQLLNKFRITMGDADKEKASTKALARDKLKSVLKIFWAIKKA